MPAIYLVLLEMRSGFFFISNTFQEIVKMTKMTSTDHITRIFSVFTCCSIKVGGTDSENKISLNGNNV